MNWGLSEARVSVRPRQSASHAYREHGCQQVSRAVSQVSAAASAGKALWQAPYKLQGHESPLSACCPGQNSRASHQFLSEFSAWPSEQRSCLLN